VPAVALTFHGAGEVALARRVLSEAAAGGAHLTVLAVGTWLAGTPALAREILDGGHELGNHTWSHPQMPQLGAAAAEAEVRRAADLLRRLTGTPGRYFRPSGTPHSTPVIRAAALRAGYDRCLSYDLDPLDYTDPAPDVVAGRVLAGVGKGSIVSLHLGHSPTVQALPVILDGLRRRGLRAVTMTQLLTGA
jgi:peptidoglycan/xylan/chitin deacetylase (PgdA/CDA1 family)